MKQATISQYIPRRNPQRRIRSKFKIHLRRASRSSGATTRTRKFTVKSESFDPSNIPRNINTKIREPMNDRPAFKAFYKMADPKLYNPKFPKHKMVEPLFVLRLHSRLSILPNYLELFCALTDDALAYIEERIAFTCKNWKKMKNCLYDKKFRAYRKLLRYLRENEQPSKELVEGMIKCGIYGERKSKFFSSKVKISLKNCFEFYSKAVREGRIA